MTGFTETEVTVKIKNSNKLNTEVRQNMKRNKKRVIPGFGLTMGVTITMLSIVVLIPLASLVVYSSQLGLKEFFAVITRRRVLSSFYVSFITALIASVINGVMGLIIAWVLVRYEFPGKKVMDGMLELPFALPTAVAGISLTSLTSDNGLIGSFFARFGIRIAYTKVGITFALIFVGIPFVARAVQPVLEKLDGSYEEAAKVMGAKSGLYFSESDSSGASAASSYRNRAGIWKMPWRIWKRCIYCR